MGKVVFWIVVVFAVLFLLRLYNVHQQNKRREEQSGESAKKGAGGKSAAGESMVRCARCGIFLPRSEAQLIEGAVRCRDRECVTHAR